MMGLLHQISTEDFDCPACEGDVDVGFRAMEMAQFTRHQILTQAGTAMLAHANQAPQNVLSLLSR